MGFCLHVAGNVSVVDAEIRGVQSVRNAKRIFYDELPGGNLQDERK